MQNVNNSTIEAVRGSVTEITASVKTNEEKKGGERNDWFDVFIQHYYEK